MSDINKGILSHLSKKLQGEYTRPRPDEVRIYRLTNIRKKKIKEGVSSFTVPNSRSIPDSYTVIDDGEIKSVVYTTRLLPTQDPTKVLRQSEPIEFRLENVGEIRITQANYATLANVDKFLFFCPWVVPKMVTDKNTGEEKSANYWQTANRLGRFIELVDKQAEARKVLEKEDIMLEARIAIKGMSEKDMELTITQLKLGMPAYLTLEEKKALLVKTANDLKMSKRITALQGEGDMILRKFIDTAVKGGIIKKTKSENEFIWVKGLESIVKKMPGKTLEDSLIFFFNTKQGKDVQEMIDLTLSAKGEKDGNKKVAATTI